MKKVIVLLFLCFFVVVSSANATIYNATKDYEPGGPAFMGPYTFTIDDSNLDAVAFSGACTVPPGDDVTLIGGWANAWTSPGMMSGSILTLTNTLINSGTPSAHIYEATMLGTSYDIGLGGPGAGLFTFDTATGKGSYGAAPFGMQDDYIWQFTATEAPAVPIPGAVLLFGSGLLCLVGIKRKIQK